MMSYEYWPPNGWPKKNRGRRYKPRPWFMRRICDCSATRRKSTGTIAAISLQQPERLCGEFWSIGPAGNRQSVTAGNFGKSYYAIFTAFPRLQTSCWLSTTH